MHSLAWLAWLVAAVAALSATRNPLYLLLVVVCLALVGVSLPQEPSRLSRPFAAWKFGLLLIGLAAIFNALTSHYGETHLFTIPGRLPLVSGDVTLEALVYGATNGLALAGLLGAFWVLGQALPVRALVGLIPRAFYPLAVVATIAVTYLPATLRQFQQIREAQAVRGHALRGLRDWLPLFMPLLVGGLERALQLSEAMTARGFASQGKKPSGSALQRAWPRLAMLAGLMLLAGGWVARLSEKAEWIGWLGLVPGIGLIGSGLWASGLHYPRSTYRPPPWRAGDTFTLAGALLVVAMLWLPLPGSGSVTLWYTPYPALHIPPFDVRLGVALLGLLGPLAGMQRQGEQG
jgi:energy-coupling factor transport system permease protein